MRLGSLLIVIAMTCFSPINSIAQYHELGFSIGGTQYSGDMDSPDFGTNFMQTRPGFGIFYKYNIQSKYAITASYLRGTLQQSDSNSSAQWQLERNLSFSTALNEFSLVGEYNLFKFDARNPEHVITPYVFAGVAYFRFNPKTEYLGQTVELQPLGTEGQGLPGYDSKYSLSQFSIPFGGGIKLKLSEKIILTGEIGARKTFTDYIDDLSTIYPDYDELRTGNGELAAALSNRMGEFLGTDPVIMPPGSIRGKSSIQDWYFAGLLKLSIRMDQLFNFGGNSKYGCPTF